ncbi:hypothetical protein [Bradyrhizobium sp. SZCCHNS30582]
MALGLEDVDSGDIGCIEEEKQRISHQPRHRGRTKTGRL